jgi:ABC-2 type transport system permease protein
MVSISKLSPLNWGLNAFYEVFLRNAGATEVSSKILLLLGFFFICILAAWSYNRIKAS